MAYYAIDFGTSNSLLNYISDSGEIIPVPLEKNGSFVLRSLIYTLDKNHWYFGSEAIEHFIENDGEGRFLRSLKKFLPDPNYTGTEIHNKKYSIENMIAILLREMKLRADKFTGKSIERVIMGRPARYSLNIEDDSLAESRMNEACKLAGFSETIFCPEPLAAGLDFDKNNTKEKNVLIADFGGGTSDFTLMRLHGGQYSQEDILGLSGIFLAGDALDGEMMLKFIAKHFGASFEFKLPMGSNTLRFPKNLLKKICSPAHITHLREKETWEYMKDIYKFASDDKSKKHLDQLFTLVECQLGYPIFQTIEDFKMSMCSQGSNDYNFKYSYPGIEITENINTAHYFLVMEDTVEKIINTMLDVFSQADMKISDIDEVVLTGGTAQFTSIYNKLQELFGADKLVKHSIYQSVVGGLSEFALLKSSKLPPYTGDKILKKLKNTVKN